MKYKWIFKHDNERRMSSKFRKSIIKILSEFYEEKNKWLEVYLENNVLNENGLFIFIITSELFEKKITNITVSIVLIYFADMDSSMKWLLKFHCSNDKFLMITIFSWLKKQTKGVENIEKINRVAYFELKVVKTSKRKSN